MFPSAGPYEGRVGTGVPTRPAPTRQTGQQVSPRRVSLTHNWVIWPPPMSGGMSILVLHLWVSLRGQTSFLKLATR